MAFEITVSGVSNGELCPQVAGLLADLERSEPPANDAAIPTPEEVRGQGDPLLPYGPVAPGSCDICEETISGPGGTTLRLRMYRPEGTGPWPVVMFLHGGCWVFCSLDTHDSICRYLCVSGGCVVVAVDYRLAPESKFPAAAEDAWTATQWVYEQAQAYGGDTEQLAVVGDSAGGNLAAAVSSLSIERGTRLPAAQVLIYPIADVSGSYTDSYRRFSTGHFFEARFLEWATDHYLSAASERENPLVSPLLSDQLAKFPVTLVQTAEFDILRDEGEALARAIADAGVSSRCVRYAGMVHAFVAMAGRVDGGRRALDDAIEFLHDAWNTSVRRKL